MGYRSIFCKSLCCSIALTALLSCTGEERMPEETNGFIQYFLDHNSERIYKSEIQRVKVNFFPTSTMLVYSFWKQERFQDNGRLFLHLYPSEVNNLIGNRRKYKFVNVPIDNKNNVALGEKFFYHFQNIQLPFDLSSLQTGQYNDTSKTWKSDYMDLGKLKKMTDSKRSLLEGENTKYAAELYRRGDLSPILGTKVYVFKDVEVEIYYNASLNRLTVISKGPIGGALKNKHIFFDYYYQNKVVERKSLTTEDLLLKKESNYKIFDIDLDQHFDGIIIGQIQNNLEKELKRIETKRLIHISYPIRAMEPDKDIYDQKNHDIQLVNQLITNNLPLLYYSTEHKLRLFLNGSGKRAYIVLDNVDILDNLIVSKEINGRSDLEKLDLDNSFCLLGKTSQIVVHELKLTNRADPMVFSLILGKKEIYKTVFE